MATTYLSQSDSGLLNWLNNASAVLSLSPEIYGSDAAGATAFAAVVSNYASAYAASNEIATRTRPAVALKNQTRTAAKIAARQMAFVAYGQPNITAEQITLIGLKVRDVSPTRAPKPKVAPIVSLLATGPQTLRAEVRFPLDPDRRAKPRSARQIVAQVYRAAEGQPVPADISTWPVGATSGRSTIDFYWPDMVATTTVHVSCYYVSSRNERGPSSDPMQVKLSGLSGAAAPSSLSGDGELRIAA